MDWLTGSNADAPELREEREELRHRVSAHLVQVDGDPHGEQRQRLVTVLVGQHQSLRNARRVLNAQAPPTRAQTTLKHLVHVPEKEPTSVDPHDSDNRCECNSRCCVKPNRTVPSMQL